MEIGNTLKPPDRAAWRAWLAQHHGSAGEIWLLLEDRPLENGLVYLDAVEEALCFGWIDGLQKRYSAHERAQRFTPRKPRSNWTELNKARARRLIRLGHMTDAGRAALPDLSTPLTVAPDIEAALKAQPDAWAHFVAFPALYQRVRVGYIEEVRKQPLEFQRRLENFVKKTQRNQLFGNWNDGGRLSERGNKRRFP
ncbi:MAG: YdeI/OmpD-associated family protein [Candidatus Sericytochromatia bacterium]